MVGSGLGRLLGGFLGGRRIPASIRAAGYFLVPALKFVPEGKRAAEKRVVLAGDIAFFVVNDEGRLVVTMEVCAKGVFFRAST